MEPSIPAARFLVDATNLQVLRCPQEFQQLLTTGIAEAKKRIGIVTLYVGAEQEAFLTNLFGRCRDGVEVHLLTDYCRTLRPERQKQTSEWKSSLETMTQVFSQTSATDSAEPHCNPMISLFHVPRRFQGQQLFPWRMQETLGVAHWKFYIFDNDVILTGANIAQSYLTNRIDRWLILRNEAMFVDFLWNLALTLRRHSNAITFSPAGEVIINAPKDSVDTLCPALKTCLNEHPTLDPQQCDLQDKALLHWGIQCGFDPSPDHLLAKSEQVFIGDALSRRTVVGANKEIARSEKGDENSTADENSTTDNSPGAPTACSLVLASPYLNLPSNTINFLRRKIEGQSLHIIGASPDASSFFQGGPVLSAVPWAYLSLTCKALSTLGSRVRVRYFSFAGQGKRTFHAKGVWNDGTAQGETYKTLLGSTNLSERSVKRDLECLCLLETRNPDVINQFRQEVSSMKKVTRTPRSLAALLSDLYQAPFLTRMISKLFVHNPFLRSIL